MKKHLHKIGFIVSLVLSGPLVSAQRPFLNCKSLNEILMTFGVGSRAAQMLVPTVETLLKEQISGLSGAQQEAFMNWLNQTKLRNYVLSRTIDAKLLFTYGQVIHPYREQMHKDIRYASQVELWWPLIHHPVGTAILGHEGVHVVQRLRLGAKNPFISVPANYRGLDAIRNEKEAIEFEYDVYRYTFELSDLEWIKKNHPFDVYEILRKQLTDPQSGELLNPQTFHAGSTTPETRAFIVSAMNRSFVTMVENALTMSKKDFIESRLKPYR